jgi:hypothetical protein
MDMDHELRRAKWLLITALFFCISACFTWGEFLYLVTGKEAVGNVGKVYEVTKRSYGSESRTLSVEYTFFESDGTLRSGVQSLSRDWPVPQDGKVKILYTPGKDGNSRLVGHANWVAIGLFALTSTVMLFFVFRLFREAYIATREELPRRKRPKVV